MDDVLRSLFEEHAELRRSFAEIVGLLGKEQDVGWNDQVNLDLPRLKEMERRFSSMLTRHERTEDTRLSAVLKRLTSEGKLSPQALQNEHRAVREIFQLLESVTSICDGQHVYALRSLLSKVTESLERHLAFEERELFPLVRDGLRESRKP